MLLDFLELHFQERDERLPDSECAREVVDQIWPRLRPSGQSMIVQQLGRSMPGVGRPWRIMEYIPLIPENAPEVKRQYAVEIGYSPTSKQFRGGFHFSASLFYHEELQTKDYLDQRARLLVELANDWLDLRPSFSAYLSTGPIKSLYSKNIKQPFPNTVTWWTWINGETADEIDRKRLLEAPVFKAYEVGGGVAWQLTERFTEKPHPSLLGELNELFPERKIKVQIYA